MPIVLALSLVVAAPLPRVYVAPINGPDKATASLVGDRVLVAARELKDAYDVVGAADVQGILDTEAAKAAVGCDTTSCENEIADALNAEQLVTGQLGRIGDTWQLTLTRTERKTLRVLGRSSRQSRGETPEGLLDAIPSQVRDLFGREAPAMSFGALAGTGGVVVGAAATAAGVGLWGWSWLEYFAADAALQPGGLGPAAALTHKQTGEAVLPWGYVVAGAGVVVAGVGATLLALSPSEGE